MTGEMPRGEDTLPTAYLSVCECSVSEAWRFYAIIRDKQVPKGVAWAFRGLRPLRIVKGLGVLLICELTAPPLPNPSPQPLSRKGRGAILVTILVPSLAVAFA